MWGLPNVCRISLLKFYIAPRVVYFVFLFEKCNKQPSTWVGCTHPGKYSTGLRMTDCFRGRRASRGNTTYPSSALATSVRAVHATRFSYIFVPCVCRKGISKSALPYRRSVATWLKSSSEDVKDHIFKLAKKGLTPSKIGNARETVCPTDQFASLTPFVAT